MEEPERGHCHSLLVSMTEESHGLTVYKFIAEIQLQ